MRAMEGLWPRVSNHCAGAAAAADCENERSCQEVWDGGQVSSERVGA